MRKLSLAFASGAIVALTFATPVFAFTSYGSTVSDSSAANLSDPDEQFDRLSGSGDTGGGDHLAQFGGSAMDASAARDAQSKKAQDDQASYSGFYIPNN